MDISIVIPVYNVAPYLARCLDSVIAQDDCVKEIILINDGSTDNGPDICKNYAEKDARIKVINQENKGLSATVRVGVKAATCEYIGFVDSDDYIEPNMFRKLSDKLTETQADVAFCNYDRYDENDIHSAMSDFGIANADAVFEKRDGRFACKPYPTLLEQEFISCSRVNKLIKRECIIENIGFNDKGVRVGEDVALILPILFSVKKIVYINECLYHYFQRSSSIVHRYNRNNLTDWKKIVDIMNEARVTYGYKIDNINDVELAWLLSVCLYKIKISDLNYGAKKAEYKFIGQDEKVRDLLRKTKIKTNLKHKLVFDLLKRGFYGLLAMVY